MINFKKQKQTTLFSIIYSFLLLHKAQITEDSIPGSPSPRCSPLDQLGHPKGVKCCPAQETCRFPGRKSSFVVGEKASEVLTALASRAEVSSVSCCKLPEQPRSTKQQPVAWAGSWRVCFSLWLPWTYFLTLCPAPAPPAAPALELKFLIVSLVVVSCPGLEERGRIGEEGRQ